MDVKQLRLAAELLATLSSFHAYEFGSLSAVGHLFSENKKYGEARFNYVEPLDQWNFTSMQWEFLPMLDNPTFSLSDQFPHYFSLTNAEHEFIEKFEKALNQGAGKEPRDDEWPSVIAFTRPGFLNVIFEILDKDTSTRIGNISYDPQKKAYTFKAACRIERIR